MTIYCIMLRHITITVESGIKWNSVFLFLNFTELIFHAEIFRMDISIRVVANLNFLVPMMLRLLLQSLVKNKNLVIFST